MNNQKSSLLAKAESPIRRRQHNGYDSGVLSFLISRGFPDRSDLLILSLDLRQLKIVGSGITRARARRPVRRSRGLVEFSYAKDVWGELGDTGRKRKSETIQNRLNRSRVCWKPENNQPMRAIRVMEEDSRRVNTRVEYSEHPD